MTAPAMARETSHGARSGADGSELAPSSPAPGWIVRAFHAPLWHYSARWHRTRRAALRAVRYYRARGYTCELAPIGEVADRG